MHKNRQSKDHAHDDEVVHEFVGFLRNEDTKDHCEDNTRRFHQCLCWIVDVLHRQVRHSQIDGSQDGQAEVELEGHSRCVEVDAATRRRLFLLGLLLFLVNIGS